MGSLTNLCPHPIRVYGWDVPERFQLGDHEPQYELASAESPARIGQTELGQWWLRGIHLPVQLVQYRRVNGLPPPSRPWDETTDWYVVSLATALACGSTGAENTKARNDLLVPYGEIRNGDGAVIGCRTLALPA